MQRASKGKGRAEIRRDWSRIEHVAFTVPQVSERHLRMKDHAQVRTVGNIHCFHIVGRL